MKTLIALSILLLITFSLRAQSFQEERYVELPLGDIRPAGWLRNQLEIMREGSSGHLDEIHEKIAIDNGWIGGKGDAWEETPYWLDGAVPLAYLLDDAVLKNKVLRYINWTLNSQRSSGYFGPITKQERENGEEITESNCEAGEDWWPKMVMLKVLRQYYSATNDPRVIPFMQRYFKYQFKSLKNCPLGKWTEWATSRGAENAMMAQWLYSLTRDHELLELAALIESQSFPWSKWFGGRDWVMSAAANQNSDHWMSRHAVNVSMALKSPAINFQRTGENKFLDDLKTGWNDIMLLHGLPMGIFSGDEDLHGNHPTHGVELCAIVESMYSLEEIISISGDIQYMDALERMTYNALPTQTTDDYNMKQYFQIANQVEVSRGVFDFSLPFDRGMTNVFGLRSGYTCCTTNMHQGWTKFTAHLWYRTDKGVAAIEYAPNDLRTKIAGEEIAIKEITNYPFSDVVDFEFSLKKSVAFPMQLRIPSWCDQAVIYLNNEELRREKGGQMITIDRKWSNNDKVRLQLPMKVRTSNWAKNSRAVERGPLVYALKISERWEKGNDAREGDYFSIYPQDAWNYGLVEDVVNKPETTLKVTETPISAGFIWNIKNAPVQIAAPARKIPDWIAINGVAHQPVTHRDGVYKGPVSDTTETLTLIPYGCTKLRIVAFPVVAK